jgi:hypothetical protein
MDSTMLTSTFNQTSAHEWLLTRRLEAVQGTWSDLVKRVDSKPNSFREWVRFFVRRVRLVLVLG